MVARGRLVLRPLPPRRVLGVREGDGGDALEVAAGDTPVPQRRRALGDVGGSERGPRTITPHPAKRHPP